MTYDENRSAYERNLKIGLAASLLFHFIILILPGFFRGDDTVQFKEGFVYTKNVDLTPAEINAFKYDIEIPGGGGGGGGGTDPNGGGPAQELVNGIPVPTSDPVNTRFDMVSYTPSDTILKNQNLKPGLGFGTGEGSGSGSGSGTGSGSGKGSGYGSGSGDGTTLIPFTPRQILEAIPERLDGFKGIIKLSVRIGKDGLVKDHKVLQNTTNNSICLVKVLEAAYKSKWQSVKIEGKVVEYWTEKTYRFE